MRRYVIEVDGRSFALAVRETGADTFEVDLDGRALAVRLVEEAVAPGAAIAPDMDRALAAPTAAPPALHTEAAPTQTGAAVAPAPLPRPGLANTATLAAAGTLTAPMPGAIASIAATAGARVRRGDVLCVLEAMKMMNPIRAPRDAVVAEVLVRAGQTVAHGDPLLRFEG
jgi:biotin carboxyl carrier protein